MRTSKEIIDYIDQLRQEQNVSIAELARRVNMSKSAVSRYFSKTREFSVNRAPKFATALHTSVNDLLGVNENIVGLKSSQKNIVKTILLKSENLVSPILSTNNVIGHVSTYLEEIPNGTLFSAKNSNDQMEPRIPNGATIMIHEQEQVDSNEVAAILVDQDIKFRRIEKIAGTTWLIPENSKYKPQILGENQIIGKAINYVGTL